MGVSATLSAVSLLSRILVSSRHAITSVQGPRKGFAEVSDCHIAIDLSLFGSFLENHDLARFPSLTKDEVSRPIRAHCLLNVC